MSDSRTLLAEECNSFVGDGPTYSCLFCGRLGAEHAPVPIAEESYTPGPWTYDQDLRDLERGGEHVQTNEALKVCALDGEQEVCEVFGKDPKDSTTYDWKYSSQALANARLIAAAPDLLAALKLSQIRLCPQCRSVWGGSYPSECTHPFHNSTEIAAAAIAKAEGRS